MKSEISKSMIIKGKSKDNFDDKLIMAKAQDLVELSYKNGNSAFSGFLNEREVSLSLSALKQMCFTDFLLFGGYENAARLILGVFPSGIENSDECLKEFTIDRIEVLFKSEKEIFHKDFLGAVMALGIKRAMIGDFLIESGRCVFFAKPSVTDFVCNELKSVGRVGVSCKKIDSFEPLPVILPTVSKTFSVASMRLDNIVSGFSGLSREQAKLVVCNKEVFLNYMVADNVATKIHAGDVVSIRKMGKFIINDTFGVTKKGRIKVEVEQYR